MSHSDPENSGENGPNYAILGQKIFSYQAQDTYKYVDIPFTNKFEWNTMVDYNPHEKTLYSWDKGHQVIYNVTFEPSDE